MPSLKQFAFGQVADEAAVGGEEVEGRQVFEGRPAEIVEDAVFDFAVEGMHREKLQIDCASVAVGVTDAGDPRADFGANAQFFIEFARKGLLGGFSRLDFAAGKLPFERHRLIRSPLADQNFASAKNDSGDNMPDGFDRALWSPVLEIVLHSELIVLVSRRKPLRRFPDECGQQEREVHPAGSAPAC
jgi:hypothetical protein